MNGLSMDIMELKNTFGNKLCFRDSIDEQHTLHFATPADVSNEVRSRIRTLGKNGGLILGPTHHIQMDIPIENFWAMVDTILSTHYTAEQ